MVMMEAIHSSAVHTQQGQLDTVSPPRRNGSSTTTIALANPRPVVWRAFQRKTFYQQLSVSRLRGNFGIGFFALDTSGERVVLIDVETGRKSEGERKAIKFSISIPFLSMALRVSLASTTILDTRLSPRDYVCQCITPIQRCKMQCIDVMCCN